ncbi:hypothetical protein NOS3756_59720 (plasmid) [Nostoc sp. NIES-3756]|uniref:hypothetical protein n=1 Tax=Nostoc sp. NIES-3756 TaxID=1751286 RepID=UPI000720B8BE|nr:hypothetical protein [Nostoc sp. NIES-3756]BAT56960.1 hypothetical protein NOS3756_59720 [Nostoc sp. NIES-3756]
MENSNKIKNENLWNNWIPRKWIQGLSLPTLNWTRPFLAMMGLPLRFVEEPDVWTAIYVQSMDEYNTYIEPLLKLEGEQYDKEDLKITLITFNKAFQQLAIQLGSNVAVDLERWVQRHFLSHEFDVAMFDWLCVLRNAYLPQGTREDQILPPDALIPLLDDIEEIIYYGIYGSQYVLQHMKLPPPLEEMEKTGQVIVPQEVLQVHRVITQELTMRTLNMIAKKLNEQELSEVMAWALSQAEAKSITSPENLCGNKYLQVEVPFFDFPSLLDFPFSDKK